MPVDGYEECNTYNSTTETMNMYLDWSNELFTKDCRKKCVKSCIVNIYTSQLTRTTVNSERPDISAFHIYFPTGIIQARYLSSIT